MNYTDTIKNIKGNLSMRHLGNYSLILRLEIIYRTFTITLKAFVIAAIKMIQKKKTPSNLYEQESSIFKAWFCYVWANEVIKV